MKCPIILVEGQDVSLFANVADFEQYVESPDIGSYRVYDADGQILHLTTEAAAPKPERRFGWVALDGVKVSGRNPPEAAPAELLKILSSYLARVTGHECETPQLAELIQEITRLAGEGKR